jgi:hypothetical protein
MVAGVRTRGLSAAVKTIRCRRRLKLGSRHIAARPEFQLRGGLLDAVLGGVVDYTCKLPRRRNLARTPAADRQGESSPARSDPGASTSTA